MQSHQSTSSASVYRNAASKIIQKCEEPNMAEITLRNNKAEGHTPLDSKSYDKAKITKCSFCATLEK